MSDGFSALEHRTAPEPRRRQDQEADKTYAVVALCARG